MFCHHFLCLKSLSSPHQNSTSQYLPNWYPFPTFVPFLDPLILIRNFTQKWHLGRMFWWGSWSEELWMDRAAIWFDSLRVSTLQGEKKVEGQKGWPAAVWLGSCKENTSNVEVLWMTEVLLDIASTGVSRSNCNHLVSETEIILERALFSIVLRTL